MILIYILSFLLLSAGTVILLGLTPEIVTDDLMRLAIPEQTLRDRVLIAQGRKRSRKLTKVILHIRDALDATGKTNAFTFACAASLLLMIAGCILAVLIDNFFMIPVFSAAFASLPFFFALNTISSYDKHVREELRNR